LNKAELKNLLENVGFRSTSAEVDAIYGSFFFDLFILFGSFFFLKKILFFR